MALHSVTDKVVGWMCHKVIKVERGIGYSRLAEDLKVVQDGKAVLKSKFSVARF